MFRERLQPSRALIAFFTVSGFLALGLGIFIAQTTSPDDQPGPSLKPESTSDTPTSDSSRNTSGKSNSETGASGEKTRSQAATEDKVADGLVVQTTQGDNLVDSSEELKHVVSAQGFKVTSIENLGNGFWSIALEEPISSRDATALTEVLVDASLVMTGSPNYPITLYDELQLDTVSRTGVTWGLDRIDQRSQSLDGRFETSDAEGAGVTAYVIDTGLRVTHQQFQGRTSSGFSAYGCGTADNNGHGTHVAGTILGNTLGVARQASVVPVDVFDCVYNTGNSDDLIAGINWIISDHLPGEPAVANISLGLDFGVTSTLLDTAVRNLINDGVTVVIASGNDNNDSCATSPGRVTEAITVNASTQSDQRLTYDSVTGSNFGSCSDIYAPGTSIESAGIANDASIAVKSGTSMAAPHVAGVAALKLGENPLLTPAQVWDAINLHATAFTPAVPGDADVLLYSGEPTVARSEASLDATVGSSISPVTFSAHFFDSTPTFSVAPTLPLGLTLNSSTGVLSGTPTQATVSATYTVTVTAGSQVAQTTIVVSVTQPAPVISQPGTPANFVRLAYQDFLGRAASDAEVAYWAGELSAGRASQASLARTLSTSDEWIQTVVRRFYVDTLGREPDAAGYAYWVNRARNGMPVADIGAFFYGSDEYFQGFGASSRDTWVRDLYQKLMLRGADSGGLNFWMGQMNVGGMTRWQVAMWFYQSPEKRGLRVDALYDQFLKRGSDAGGRAYWANRIAGEGDLVLASMLASSPEYYGRQHAD